MISSQMEDRSLPAPASMHHFTILTRLRLKKVEPASYFFHIIGSITQGEQVGQEPFHMEIALLETMAIRHQFCIRYSHIGTIYPDCESLVSYLLNRVSTGVKNSINLNFPKRSYHSLWLHNGTYNPKMAQYWTR